MLKKVKLHLFCLHFRSSCCYSWRNGHIETKTAIDGGLHGTIQQGD